MDDHEYHSDFTHVSKTMLNLFCESRQEFYYTYVTQQMRRKEPTAPMLIGTVLHAMLLEDKQLDDLVLCYPDECLNVNGGLIGPRRKAFEAENPGRVFLKEDEYGEIATAAATAMNNYDSVRRAIGNATSREQRYDGEIAGMKCRCKPDVVVEEQKRVVIPDFKMCASVHPSSFRRTSKRLRYWLQDSHYSAILQQHFGKPVQFQFCCIETSFPFRVQWYWYDEISRESADAAHKKILRDLKECYVTGDWSDRWESMVTLEPWDIEQDDLVEVEQ